MSFVTVEEVQARQLGAGYTDDALQAVIDGVEAELALEIGPLTGERDEVFYPRRRSEPLWLRRPTDDTVEVDDNGTERVVGEEEGNFRLLYSGFCLELIISDWTLNDWSLSGPVTVTYTPIDEARVREAVIDLVREELMGSTPYVSERIGEYSYSLAQSPGASVARRNSIFRRFKPPFPFRSERVISSVRP